ncbi:FAD:protein FMN transferase [Rugamonas rubra]|uniref:FAD:protein FMN transferase n=1 Tax=Rugamonas rubra TaxID=758825 RepID=A0A1I4MK17_9BURK|nr:FAD:protein FMN transferase [Rugamonas rubra]SFM03548.1 thiamine biosynthesis lipoprotein [Rugamonas rubra]
MAGGPAVASALLAGPGERRVLLPAHIAEQAAPAHGAIRDFAGVSMGTGWSVRLVDHGRAATLPPRLQQGLQGQLDQVVAQMSHWESDSDLGRFNLAEAGSWQRLPEEFFTVLAFAMRVARDTGDAYDPCAGAMVNLWGFGPAGGFERPGFAPPDAAQVARLLERRRQARVELDHAGRRARQPGGVLLDLSAVAKGYGVDRLAEYLEAQGIRHYLVEVGGELRGAGVKPDGQPWWVALEQPGASTAGMAPSVAALSAAAPAGPAAAAASAGGELVLALHGLAVATSGDYRRYFNADAADLSSPAHTQPQRYSHTIDPRSGMPITNQLASVTVVHAQCMAADAWSTALTVLGPEAGLALADRLGLAARFVLRTPDGCAERLSAAFQQMLA